MNVAPDVSQKPRIVKYYSGCSRELLCRCKYFETERIQVTKGFAFSVMDASFQVLMCLNGYVLLVVQSIVLLLEDGIVLYGVEIGMLLMIVILYAGDLMSIAKKGKQAVQG